MQAKARLSEREYCVKAASVAIARPSGKKLSCVREFGLVCNAKNDLRSYPTLAHDKPSV